MCKFKIVEGIAGVWHYHLASADSDGRRSLCGKKTMQTTIPVSTWGIRSEHIPESYCKACEKIRSGKAVV